jgi:hypothetical protein
MFVGRHREHHLDDCVIRLERYLKHATDDVGAALTKPESSTSGSRLPAEIVEPSTPCRLPIGSALPVSYAPF